MNSKEGLHLLVDGYCKPEGKSTLSSKDSLKELIIGLVDRLGMHILHGPTICDVPLDLEKVDKIDDSGGITAFCIITTSHISIHTWPLESRFSFDAYSCKRFDTAKALAYLEDRLHLGEHVVQVVERTL